VLGLEGKRSAAVLTVSRAKVLRKDETYGRSSPERKMSLALHQERESRGAEYRFPEKREKDTGVRREPRRRSSNGKRAKSSREDLQREKKRVTR